MSLTLKRTDSVTRPSLVKVFLYHWRLFILNEIFSGNGYLAKVMEKLRGDNIYSGCKTR